MVSQKVIRAAIEAYFSANNALDVEGFVNAFAPDASMYNVAEISPITGHEAIRQVARQMLLPCEETAVTMDKIFITGNGAAIFYSGHLTAKNGRTAQVEGIDVFEVNDEGKIQSIRLYFGPNPAVAALYEEAAK
ncbi:nuclear transport factor 2 family protein [Ktedonospora formicarum]|uniref:SnoaL-like domain-containing protein n=1 Tax=Ktedonospora formicarum TaxID=2778364 RepID=A0A8J3I760_9CHLR|nr:nuclear transport factor 2 family protein [Ktedonospora formicarum]GHO47058.1 hypothetical protein KSX_52210 [Ktedonospora formicarum]